MRQCHRCGQGLADEARFCTRCGVYVFGQTVAPPPVPAAPDERGAEEMNVAILYIMVAVLVLAALFPPWETPPGRPPEFLGFHFIGHPPEVLDGAGVTRGIVSRILVTIELTTIAAAGFYLSWLFRKKGRS